MTTTPPPATPDDTLFGRYNAGDTGAFDSLYARYHERVWRYAFRAMGYDNTVAADLCQDIWLKVVRAAPAYEPSGRFDRWLFGIAHNAVVDRYRRTEPAAETAEDVPDLAHFVARFEVTDTLGHALQQLNADQRSALLLHHVEGYTLDEVAALQNSRRETIKSRVRYGMTALRTLLGGDHDARR